MVLKSISNTLKFQFLDNPKSHPHTQKNTQSDIVFLGNLIFSTVQGP